MACMRILKELIQLNNINSITKMDKDLKRHFTKEEM